VLIFSFESAYLLGIVYGLISAFLAAIFGTINGKYVQNGHKAATISLYEMIGGVIGATVYLAIIGSLDAEFFQVSNYDWMLILVIGLVCTTFAFVAGVYVMKTLSPFTVALTINLEPVYGILLALAIYKESEYMSGGFYWGAVIIIATIIANAWYKKRLKAKGKTELG
jgi:drug/metabolite transporter (DMT)-like permease